MVESIVVVAGALLIVLGVAYVSLLWLWNRVVLEQVMKTGLNLLVPCPVLHELLVAKVGTDHLSERREEALRRLS